MPTCIGAVCKTTFLGRLTGMSDHVLLTVDAPILRNGCKGGCILAGLRGGLVAGSFVGVWRKWKHRAGLGSAKLGPLAVLP